DAGSIDLTTTTLGAAVNLGSRVKMNGGATGGSLFVNSAGTATLRGVDANGTKNAAAGGEVTVWADDTLQSLATIGATGRGYNCGSPGSPSFCYGDGGTIDFWSRWADISVSADISIQSHQLASNGGVTMEADGAITIATGTTITATGCHASTSDQISLTALRSVTQNGVLNTGSTANDCDGGAISITAGDGGNTGTGTLTIAGNVLTRAQGD